MTTEERISALEGAVVSIVGIAGKLTTVLEAISEQQGRLEEVVGRLEERQGRLEETVGRLEEMQVQLKESVEEYRRDTRQYQRLWVHLAQKHGWLDEDDWPPPGGGPQT